MKIIRKKKLGFITLAGIALLMLVGIVGVTLLENSESVHSDNLGKLEGEYHAELTTAPRVPESLVEYDAPHKVIVPIVVKEKKLAIAGGVEYAAWTFNGTIPGPFIRVREGDLVEVHFSNHPDNKVPHNIDFHAVTGPGGGAEATMTAPGYTTVFSFRALHPGLFIYHCAAPPVGMHIANGMYGMILVEPKEGLAPVDKEFFLVQSEFYTDKLDPEEDLYVFNIDKALKEEPGYVVFNGSMSALTGENALNAEVGDKIRLYVGNIGPSLISSFHVIGEIFDNVYPEGGTAVTHNIQTAMVPVGGSTIVEFTVDVPGTYTMIDHSIFRAFNKGAIAQLIVTGEENKKIYTGTQDRLLYNPKHALEMQKEVPKATEDKRSR